MTYEINNHYLECNGDKVPFQKTPNHSGIIKPTVIVVHDTAGAVYDKNRMSSVNWLCNPAAKASAHLVVLRNGVSVQLTPLNLKCWHAGKSSLHGRASVSDYSIGIEICNPGILTKQEDYFLPWFRSEKYMTNDYRIERKPKSASHPEAYWMGYTQEQIDAVFGMCRAMVRHYGIKEIVPHWLISPGRKIDTNPLFPLQELRDYAFSVNTTTDKAPDTVRTLYRINARSTPYVDDNILYILATNVNMNVLDRRSINGVWWLKIRAEGEPDAWIQAEFTETAEVGFLRKGLK
jgi:N-acetylmuramoyl-L-alanine amidase